ncbi:hypothetical protein GQ54DRAFT_306164 [Martensiomyces pterosporus]|nr:hypothetical protein GQ54DRAFT_306164 [Martensiomyces pterosporus]
MSLSRLPQVALRRLMPAITVVPKNLDDDQLKKILEQQPISGKGSLPAKAELSQLTTTQGLIAALSKSGSSVQSPALGRLLKNLTGSQGMLSSQDLALLKAASSTNDTLAIDSSSAGSNGPAATKESQDYSLLATPEPASPSPESALGDQEPTTGALDSASVDALISALRGTAAISSEDSSSTPSASAASTQPPAKVRRRSPTAAAQKREPQHVSALEEHNAIAFEASSSLALEASSSEHSDDDLPPIPSNLSAAERRKEQNRRAQKKFRQKDKVRQKEVKWRASQYEDLVATNKRFKKDIDSITKERDMYRRILELNGIRLSEDVKIASSSSPSVLATTPASPAAIPTLTLNSRSASVSSVPTVPSPVLSPTASLGMDQLALDTFGVAPAMPMAQASSPMNDLLNTLVFGAVKSDPMFGSSGMFNSPSRSAASVPTDAAQTGAAVSAASSKDIAAYSMAASSAWLDAMSPSSDALSADSPLVVDHGAIDSQYAQQSIIDSHFVDPMTFIDELLASPGFSPSSLSGPQSSPGLQSSPAPESIVRKRSFEDTMF